MTQIKLDSNNTLPTFTDYIKPDFVHIMHNGKIIKTGDAKLAEIIEKEGYGWLVINKNNILANNLKQTLFFLNTRFFFN